MELELYITVLLPLVGSLLTEVYCIGGSGLVLPFMESESDGEARRVSST
jgi:hypothetical protein